MSQRKEKYLRRALKKCDKAEERVEALSEKTYILDIRLDMMRKRQNGFEKELMKRRWETRKEMTMARNALVLSVAAVALAAVAVITIFAWDKPSTEIVLPEAQEQKSEVDPVKWYKMPVVTMAAEAAEEEQKSEVPYPLDGAQLLGQAKITHYCICQKCCGKSPDHPAYGITASGRPAVPNVSVAVDRSLIPLGSEVLIDYGDGVIHTYSADDTGSGVDGKHIDVCSVDHQTAWDLGVKTAEVWFIAPENELQA